MESNWNELTLMEEKLNSLEASEPASCEEFSFRVNTVREVIRPMYRAISFAAKLSGDPAKSAEHWACFIKVADFALRILKGAREKFPHCGAPELFDMALEYRHAAKVKLDQSIEDEACSKIQIPNGLFQTNS